MNYFDIAVSAVVLTAAAVMAVYYFKSTHPIKNLFIGAGSGVLTLLIAKYAVSALGITVSINIFTVIVSAVLGIPGAVSTIILNSIFGVG